MNLFVMIGAFAITMALVMVFSERDSRAAYSANNETVVSAAIKNVDPVKNNVVVRAQSNGVLNESMRSTAGSEEAATDSFGKKIGEIFVNIVKGIVVVILSLLFISLPQKTQRSILKAAGKIIMVVLSLVTLGLFMGVNTWKNDR